MSKALSQCDDAYSLVMHFNGRRRRNPDLSLFVYQKPSDQDPHCYRLFAYNWFGAGSGVQVSMKKFERSVVHKCYKHD